MLKLLVKNTADFYTKRLSEHLVGHDTALRWAHAQVETRHKPPLVIPWGKTEASYNCSGEITRGKSLVLGVYAKDPNPNTREIVLTRSSFKYNEKVCGKLIENIRSAGPVPRLAETRVFVNMDSDFPIVCVVGLGPICPGYHKSNGRDEGKECIRKAVGGACRALQKLRSTKIFVESFGHAESAAEGAGLGCWLYQDLKNTDKSVVPSILLYDSCDFTGWEIGLEKAAAQNLSRQLMETPANLMTPTQFALSTVEALCPTGVNVHIKVQEWLQEKGMNAFLAVAKGSYEHPIFLEVRYNGCDPTVNPIVLIGKGVTYDSGGLCLKPKDELKHMRGDVQGAACVVATVRAVASLRLPINVVGLMPLCENMPGACACKPGDIVTAMNGKTILIDDTDCEGTLLLADSISYAKKFKPKFILDVGSLTKGMQAMVSSSASGVFTNNESLWKTMLDASVHSGDRVWRMPLWDYYTMQVRPKHITCDLSNFGNHPGASTCTSAAFLKEFVKDTPWIHLDTYNVLLERGNRPYLRRGMSGRPTRTMIEFLAQLACCNLSSKKGDRCSEEKVERFPGT